MLVLTLLLALTAAAPVAEADRTARPPHRTPPPEDGGRGTGEQQPVARNNRSVAFSAEAAEKYRRAVELYHAGRNEEAGKLFLSLTASPEAAALAHFAMGNLLVLQAQNSDTERSQLLKEAIRHYRVALDLGASAPLVEEDVRFNLELAKKRLAAAPKSNGTSDESPAGDRREEKTADRDLTTAPDDDPSKKKPDADGPSSHKDQGIVQQPLPGLPFEDPGPLERKKAVELLSQALQRIQGKQKSAFRPKPQKPRPSADDY